ncbi:hypothetical protein PHMEG_0007833, partial [Phytophthora megakarya]
WQMLQAAGWPSGMCRHRPYVMPAVKGRLGTSRQEIDFFVGEYWAYIDISLDKSNVYLYLGEEKVMKFGRKASKLQLAGTTVPLSLPEPTEDAATPQPEPQFPSTRPVDIQTLIRSQSVSQADATPRPMTQPPDVVLLPATQDACTTEDSLAVAYRMVHNLDIDLVQSSPAVFDLIIIIKSEEEKVDEDHGHQEGIDEFDCDQFIGAMRSEKLFGPVHADDVNISEHCPELTMKWSL